MPHRVLNVVWALATCIPVLAQAQQSLGPMSGAQREGSWELSVGAGATYLDNQLISVVQISAPSAKRVVPGGVLRLGYNLGKMWSLSVGTFAGYAKPATVLQPFGAISWTPNVDRSSSR